MLSDTITLEELVQRAPLLTRVDRKYVLPSEDLPELLDKLSGTVRVLDIAGQRQFGYRSAYFDSSTLDCYLDAARRRRRRFKVRIRTYLDTRDQFVEIKTRGPRGRTIKQRAPYSGYGSRLGSAARTFGEGALAKAGIPCDLTAFGLVLTTSYQRTTLFAPATNSRITIDTGLTWEGPGGTAVELPGLAIVETKSGQAIPELDRLLWSVRYRPCSISKYGTGLAALRPDLPSHHWLPVLRRHFNRNES
jgi:hypothetical protein